MYLSLETTLKPLRMRNLFKNCIHPPAGVSAVEEKLTQLRRKGSVPG